MIRMARAESLGDPEIRRAVTASGLGHSLIGGATLFGALMLGAQPLADGFFGDGSDGLAAAGIAVGLLMLLGVMDLMAGPGSTAAGLLRELKDTRAPMLYTLAGHWGVGAPLGLYLSEAQGLGITGVSLVSTLLTLRRLGVFSDRSLEATF